MKQLEFASVIISKVMPCKFEPVRFLLIGFFMVLSISSTKAQQNLYELKIGHPRIMMTKYDELALRFIMMEDPVAEKLLEELKNDADDILSQKDIKYGIDEDGNMLATSRTYLKRIITLSLAYRLLEVDKYSDKAISQMMHVAAYPNWNPNHFLDVAEMTAALAIGYDWNFYHLNIREKEIIRNRIVELGLKPGLEAYKNPDSQPYLWYKNDHTWNQVCAGGLILGALAVGEDFPDLKNNIIYNTIKNLVPTIDLYRPDGVAYEGFERWEYGASYLSMALSSLNSALEHDFGLSQRPGVEKTATFYINSASPSGNLYNYADANDSNSGLTSLLFWFSKHFYDPDIASYQKELLKNQMSSNMAQFSTGRNRLFYLSLAWFDDSNAKAKAKPRAQAFRGPVDILILQGSARAGDGLYLAAKSGKGNLGNQQLDAGSFVIDSNGERWGIDLGGEYLDLPNMNDDKVGGARWTYYRNTNKSHSTLVIDDALQNPEGESTLSIFNDTETEPFGIFDLSEVYRQAEKAERGFKLLTNDRILIRDEIDFGGLPKKVRWAMMTDAKIELAGDKAILTKNEKRFFIQAFAEQTVKFEIKDANAYHNETKENAGKKVLFFVLNENLNRSTVNISVVLGNNLVNLSKAMVDSQLMSWQ